MEYGSTLATRQKKSKWFSTPILYLLAGLTQTRASKEVEAEFVYLEEKNTSCIRLIRTNNNGRVLSDVDGAVLAVEKCWYCYVEAVILSWLLKRLWIEL